MKNIKFFLIIPLFFISCQPEYVFEGEVVGMGQFRSIVGTQATYTISTADSSVLGVIKFQIPNLTIKKKIRIWGEKLSCYQEVTINGEKEIIPMYSINKYQLSSETLK